MAKITVTFTITEFCLHTGLSEDELNEIVGLGMIEPRQPQRENWLFDDSAVTIVHRAVRLRKELELDWPGNETFPPYGLVRKRMDLDEILARYVTPAHHERRF